MKTIIICFLLGFSLSYNIEGAVSYALKHCGRYNPNYNFYKYKEPKAESVNFVSQCIGEGGGQDFSGCKGRDDKGMFKDPFDLANCLVSKGWTKTRKFTRGSPIMVLNSFLAFVTSYSSDGLYICSHAWDRCEAKYTNVYYVEYIYAPPSS